MTDKERERIKRIREKSLKKFARRERRRQMNYFDKVVKMSDAERKAELEKCERKIAKYEDAEWVRKRSLRFAGGVILTLFAVVYLILWLVGVSHHTWWGLTLLALITLAFLCLIASFMDVYRNGGDTDAE